MHSHFCTFGADLHAQSVLVNKISASELSRKFIKECVVGWEVGEHGRTFFFVPLQLRLLPAIVGRHRAVGELGTGRLRREDQTFSLQGKIDSTYIKITIIISKS